jgi:diguanylate cyclase (GGDEF)-like protein/putative nucleotidyltransferase with HDIG domain
MRDWEERRNNEISENILVTHIVSLLIFMMILFSFWNYPIIPNNKVPYPGMIVFTLFCLGIAIYTARRLIARFTLLDRRRIDEILLLAVMLPVTFAFLWYSRGFSGAKVLLVVPAIITATAFGKVCGAGEALLTCGLLFLLDYIFHRNMSDQAFQSDFIITGVTVLLAWVVGGLIEVEQKTQQELANLADHDTLTGLINHRYLQERLSFSLAAAARERTPLSLVLLDIDQLKYYNALYGYQKGDLILESMGKLLQEEIGAPSYAARYGGDEFMLVLPGQTIEEARRCAGEIAPKLVARASAVLLEDQSTPSYRDLAITWGAVSYPQDGEAAAATPPRRRAHQPDGRPEGRAQHPERPAEAATRLIRAAETDLFRTKYSEGLNYLYQSVISEISAMQSNDAFPTLQTFIALINSKDRYTFGHSERVISYAMALAAKLGLDGEEKEILRFAGYLHDIGKIEIESMMLNKGARLNKEERRIMERHPILGSEMIRPVASFLPVVPIIRSHHENWDGSGYPDGCRGEEIPLLSRILRIADSFDAMTTDRPYRKALSLEEACQELKNRAGAWYDPHLVQLFLEIVRNVYRPAV